MYPSADGIFYSSTHNVAVPEQEVRSPPTRVALLQATALPRYGYGFVSCSFVSYDSLLSVYLSVLLLPLDAVQSVESPCFSSSVSRIGGPILSPSQPTSDAVLEGRVRQIWPPPLATESALITPSCMHALRSNSVAFISRDASTFSRHHRDQQPERTQYECHEAQTGNP